MRVMDEPHLSSLVLFNPENTDITWRGKDIYYMDISSIGFGVFNSKPLKISYDSAPSRARRVVKHGDVIISTVRPNRRSMIQILNPKPNTVVSTGFAVLRPKRIADSDYVFGLISSQRFTSELVMLAYGAAYPAVSISDLNRIKINIPSVKSRDEITKKLNSINNQLNELESNELLAEEVLECIFKSWFVNFNPVKENWQNVNKSVIKHDALQIFPSSFVDSEIGPMPEGWRLVQLKEILDVVKGLSYKGDYLEEEEHQGKSMLNLGCFAIDGSFRRNKIKFYSGEYNKNKLLSFGDLLMANTDMTQDRVILGACIIIPKQYEGSLFTHHTFKLKLKNGIDKRLGMLLKLHFQQPGFRHIAEGYSTGSTVLALPKDAILNYSIMLPGKVVLEKFLNIASKVFLHREENVKSKQHLINLREIILQELIWN
jgi:type I restriction enzyme, S subunit